MNGGQSALVVFGGAGFIGHHLLKRLGENGAYRLISIDIRPPLYPVPGVEYRIADVRDLSALTIKGDIARIYNLAAVHTTPGHPAHAYYETNIAGATEVTAFARRHNVDEILFTSSISVYGPDEQRKDESSRPTPESAYGWSKYLAEGIHRAWLDENATRRLVIVRPAVIFGPHEGGNFTRMASLLKKGLFVYPGRKDTIKACYYVQDLLDAFENAIDTPARFVLFNACYPDRYTIAQIVGMFRAGHFPRAREFTIPFILVKALAQMLRPMSLFNLGIHPDRVRKLTRSTDIVPAWLEQNGFAKKNGLEAALQAWSQASAGRFD